VGIRAGSAYGAEFLHQAMNRFKQFFDVARATLFITASPT
jgi:hypothetical protein